MRFLSFITLFSLSFILHATDFNAKPTRQQMLSDLDFLKTTLEVQYAPKQWKNEHFQWDLEKEITIAQDKVKNLSNITVKDYQRILKEFLTTTSDFHVSARFCSTESTSLPFQIMGAQGKYFVCFVENPLELIQVGDEILAIDNAPIDQVIEQLSQEFGTSPCPSSHALAELMLTYRSGKVGHIVPQGNALITVKHKNGVVETFNFPWNYQQEQVLNPIVTAAMESSSWSKKSMKAFAADFKATPQSPFDLGQRESFIPALGRKIWDSGSESHFQAYIYENSDKKRIGYLRIPTYSYVTELAIFEFPELITRMQNNTDALVIDQIHNPGGFVFYLYFLASHLSEKSLQPPPHRWTINQFDVLEAVYLNEILGSIHNDAEAQMLFGPNFFGYPINLQLMKTWQGFMQFVLEEWSIGRTLTDPYHFFGVDVLQPAKVCYTKPILVLVDQLSFSGGDFFPAILQDNDAATIFGTRTAGAGGFVSNVFYPNLLGIEQIYYTGSLAERKNNQPLENLGVTPDISYEITPDDLQNNFKGYVQAINNAVDYIIKKG